MGADAAFSEGLQVMGKGMVMGKGTVMGKGMAMGKVWLLYG